ncbi:MAG: UDP-N-acetylglucosamine 2-epimerase (non-hydrolyzing) [Pseudanabaenaceae cyanobacterium bins.68]|nr:UDP-N-acetylglucosamine 2-epimerase (non-hydrolyzing) [Pseudanabaenaceae cyanobacterium bins.68]
MTSHVCVVLGTRPEAIKLAPVVAELGRHPHFRSSLVLTGQHRQMVAQVLDLFELRPDRDLEIMQPKQSLSEITCRSLAGLGEVFRELQPDLVLVQGDTTTAFAASLAAFYQQIPLGHVEAGLRTNDLFSPFPEEANRRLISQLAQLHFAPTPSAVNNLELAHVTGKVYMTGNTVIDALLYVAEQIKRSPDLFTIEGIDWSKYRWILATLHRRENWGLPLQQIAQAWLEILAEFPEAALLLPLHLNPVVREPLQQILAAHPRVFLVEPLSYGQLVAGLQHCELVMTDSGGLQEEAPSLGKPVLVLRDTTERPEAIAAGTARLVGTETAAIVGAARELLGDRASYDRMAHCINPFGDGRAAVRICALIHQYFLDQRSGSFY